MTAFQFVKALIPAAGKFIWLTVKFKCIKAYNWVREKFGAQLSIKDYSLDHLRGRYYINTGKNDLHIEPDLAFADDLTAGGGEIVKKSVLKPYEHCWVQNNFIIIRTSDEQPALTRICFDHASLKKVKRELRKDRNSVG